MHVTLQLVPPFPAGRPDLSLRITEMTTNETFIENAVQQSKTPRGEKFQMLDGALNFLVPSEELIGGSHVFIKTGEKKLPFDNVAYTDDGDASVILKASHTQDVSPPGACAAQQSRLGCYQAQCGINMATPLQAHETGSVPCLQNDIQTEAFVHPGTDVDGEDSEEDDKEPISTRRKVSKSAKKGAKRGEGVPWLPTMNVEVGDFIPIGPDGFYVMVSFTPPHQ